MDNARTKYGNAHHHRWSRKCWDRWSVVMAEEGIAEFVEELSLLFGLFDEDTQIRLQGDNMTTDFTISSNISDCMLPRMRCPFRVSTWTTSWDLRVTYWQFGAQRGWTYWDSVSIVDMQGTSFTKLTCGLSYYVSEWLQTDHKGIGFTLLLKSTLWSTEAVLYGWCQNGNSADIEH